MEKPHPPPFYTSSLTSPLCHFLLDRLVRVRESRRRVAEPAAANSPAATPSLLSKEAFEVLPGPPVALLQTHFFTITVVPRFWWDTISNSSIIRLTPGNPSPGPPLVEKPSCKAFLTLDIPGPLSLATTITPDLFSCWMLLSMISPRPAYWRMLRANSETAVAIIVDSRILKSVSDASSRAYWRAWRISRSEVSGILTCSTREHSAGRVLVLNGIC